MSNLSGGCGKLDPTCVLLAGTGIVVLMAIIYDALIPFAPAATSIVALSIGLALVRGLYERIIITLLVALSWTVSIFLPEYAVYGGSIVYLATIYSLIVSGSAAAISVFGASMIPLLVGLGFNSEAILVSSTLYIVLAGLIASLITNNLHPLIIVAASPLVLLLGDNAGLAASTIAFMTVISVSGTTRKVGCPFRIDSGLVFIGSVIGVFAVISIVFREALGDLLPSIGLWALSYLFLLAGVLVPSWPPQTSSSLDERS